MERLRAPFSISYNSLLYEILKLKFDFIIPPLQLLSKVRMSELD